VPLKDYTTTVSVHRTIGEITEMLVKAGARGVMQEYGDHGRVTALKFVIPFDRAMLSYALPIDADRVRKVLAEQRVAGKYLELAHCERVAWRIVRDWIAAQLAIIETEMVTVQQVMLPYMLTEDGQTVFARFRSTRALPA
jgi:hypothetical protein